MRLRRTDDNEPRKEPKERKRKRKGNRRTKGAIAAVVLATVGAVGLVAFVQGAEERALAGERLVEVLVVTERVDAGTPAEDLGGSVTAEEVPAKTRTEGAITDMAALSGFVANVELLPGEQLTAARFVPRGEFTGRSTQVSVPEGLLEVTVSLEPERAVGGVVRPGSTVGVLASFDPFDASGGSAQEGDAPQGVRTPNSTHMILHKVLVTNVQSPEVRGLEIGGEGEEESGAPTDNLLVTLALDAPSVERVVFAAEHGTIWLSLEPETAGTDGTQVLTRGSIYG